MPGPLYYKMKLGTMAFKEFRSIHKAHYDLHNIHLYATYEDKDSTRNVHLNE